MCVFVKVAISLSHFKNVPHSKVKICQRYSLSYCDTFEVKQTTSVSFYSSC